MKRILLICFILLISLDAKDFYYSFIGDDKSQVSEFRKKQILAGNYKLNTIKRLVREGQIDDAYKRISKFKERNKLKILNSNIILLYADVLYKKGNNKLAREAIVLLENGINTSKIKKEDLLDAYKLLVVLNIKVNKPKNAKYYANAISHVFDHPLSRAFGKIALAQIYIHKRQYKQAIKILYRILVKTNNIDVATVVADELYDAYVLNGEDKKAYELAGKVLQKNIQYYANDSFLALKKVDKLTEANMPDFAIKILKMLLNNAVEPESISRFKFKLANTYMKIAGRNKQYMIKAKELYKDIMVQKNRSPHYQEVRIDMDEILMREGKLEPSTVAAKYPRSKIMEQKVLLQELLNLNKKQDYVKIQKMKKIYHKISVTVAKRFGFKSIEDVFDMINANMIAFYLSNEKCIELSEVLYIVRDEALNVLIKDDNRRKQLFDCLTEIPDLRSYEMARNTFNRSKDGELYLALEKIALLLNKTDDAYEFIQKIDMVNDPKIQAKEFLYRFLVYGRLNNETSMEQFFRYTNIHPEYIDQNINNPLIIDFYYQYYLYLQKKNQSKKAIKILKNLYNTQNKMKAFIYSPFVELEIAKEFKLEDDYKQSLVYLEFALKNTRSIKDNDLANIYYEMAKIYEIFGKKNRYIDTVDKCKNLKKANNFYKKMCDRL